MQTGDPRFFNRYAYTFNDPVNLTDPTGECPICPVILGAIWLADKAYGAYDAAQTAKGIANGTIDPADAAISQAASQAGGAIGGPIGRVAAKKATKAAKLKRLDADPKAEGDHTVWKTDGDGPFDGDITRHETFEVDAQNPRTGFKSKQSTDIIGKAHRKKPTGEKVSTPHTQGKDIPGGVRPATPDEIPKPRN